MPAIIDDVTIEAQQLAVDAAAMLGQYQAYSVISNESLLMADNDLSRIKEKLKQMDEERKRMTRPLDETKARIMDFFRKPTEMLNQAREAINKAMTAYRQEQERIRLKQESDLREIARKAEEKKRKALEARAAKAEASGKADKAEDLRAKAQEVFVPTPVVQSTVAETKNKPRQIWKYRVKDINLVPREHMIVNDLAMGQIARATKGTLSIPGIEFYSEDSKF